MWLHFISLTLYIFRGALSTFTVLSTLVIISLFQFLCSVQSLSQVQPFATPWTAARQASLSITNSRSLLKLMSIESVMPSNHLILCHLLVLLPSIFPGIRVSPVSQFFTSRGQTTGVSISASVFPKNIQDWFPLGWTWLDLLAVQGTLKSLLQHHSSIASIPRRSAFFRVQLSYPYIITGKIKALTRWNLSVLSLLF